MKILLKILFKRPGCDMAVALLRVDRNTHSAAKELRERRLREFPTLFDPLPGGQKF
jgi:hypothetical protein